MKKPRLVFKTSPRLGRYQLRMELVALGRCSASECAYSNDWCPNGCKEIVYFDVEDRRGGAMSSRQEGTG